MPQYLLRIVIYGILPTNVDVELRKNVEIAFELAEGSILPTEHSPGRPQVVKRVHRFDTDYSLVDVENLHGDFEELACALIDAGWRPYLDCVFDNEDNAVEFAEGHGDTLIRIDGKFYSVPPAAMWCVLASGMEYEKITLRYERN